MDDLPPEPSPKAQLKLALEWLRMMEIESPVDATPSTAARIFQIKEESSVRSAWYRERKKRGSPTRQNGGQNRILSRAQHEAIIQYARDQGRDLGATKSMVFSAICHLKATETPPAPHPSDRWFQKWLKRTQVLIL
jgi:hypothetical protein